MNQDNAGLPTELADRITKPFARFLKIEAAAGVILLLATCAALDLSNSAWSMPFLALWKMPIGLHLGSWDFTRSLLHWINDGLMTLFFFVVALELKRELVLGELRNPRMAALSFAGAFGGMIAPVSLYLPLMAGHPGLHGWGTVMATDTAFVMGCLAVLGTRIPPSLRLFLLSLAIFDDVGAILVVAVGYGDTLNWVALALATLGLAAVAGAARIGIRSVPIYFLFGGVIWLCFDASGIHPTVAGVILGLMTPTRGWVSDQAPAHYSRSRAFLPDWRALERGHDGSPRPPASWHRGNGNSLSRGAVRNDAAPVGGLRDHADFRIRQCRSCDLRHVRSGSRFR